MEFYGFGYQELLDLPVETFWMLNKNVDRISAEKDIRTSILAIHTQSGEGFTTLMKDLKKQMGVVIDYDEAALVKTEKLDREGLMALKSMTL